MRCSAALLDLMVEGRAGLVHGNGPDGLANEGEEKAKEDPEGLERVAEDVEGPVSIGKEDADENSLDEGEGVSNGVAWPVLS